MCPAVVPGKKPKEAKRNVKGLSSHQAKLIKPARGAKEDPNSNTQADLIALVPTQEQHAQQKDI